MAGGSSSNRQKKWIRIAGITLITILLLEFSPYLYYPLLFDTGFDRSDIRERLLNAAADSTNFKEVNYDPEKQGQPNFIEHQILHPYFGFIANPAYVEEISEHGFYIDPKRDYSIYKLRVCILGGSFADGVYTQSQHAMIKRLSDLTGIKYTDIWIVSLASVGYKQPQQLLALNYFLALGGDFDVVVNIDGFNEVMLPYNENLRLGVHPFFPRSWSYYAKKSNDPELIAKISRIKELRKSRASSINFTSTFPFSISNTFLAIWDRGEANRANEITTLNREILEIPDQEDIPLQASGPKFDVVGSDSIIEEFLTLWNNCSRQMDQISKANDLPYLHFIQPNQFVEGSKPWTENEKEIFGSVIENHAIGFLNRAYDRMGEIANESRANGESRIYDLRYIFKENTDDLYIDACCHVNQAGYDIIATAIADSIFAEITLAPDLGSN